MMVAPSWSGAFLKKMVSRTIRLTFAPRVCPVPAKAPSGSLRSKMRSTPVLVLAKFFIALTTASVESELASEFPSVNILFNPRQRLKVADPTTSKNLRISCWNTMIKIINPAPMNEPKISLNKFICRSCTRLYKR